MTMVLNVDEKYINKLESFISSLPKGAIEVKNSLDDVITKRVESYESSQMQTTPLMEGLDTIREKLVSRL